MITLFKSIRHTNPVDHISIEDFFNRISNQKKFSPELRELAKSNSKVYNERKNQLPCYCIGTFKERKVAGLLEYSPILAFDIDKLTSKTTFETVLKKVKELDYIYAVFPSVSNRGLRIFIKTNSQSQYHKQNYKIICEKLSNDLKEVLIGDAILDTSTQDVSRAWYYEYLLEGELTINKNAKTFSVPNVNRQAPIKEKTQNNLSDITILNMCNAFIELRTLKGRNERVFHLTKFASEYGVQENSILTYCSDMVNNSIDNLFSIEEIKRTVSSGFIRDTKPLASLIKQFENKFGKNAYQQIVHKENKISNDELEKLCSTTNSKSNRFEKLKKFVIGFYKLRFNEISKKLEIFEKFDDKKEVNVHDIECKLFENGFTGFRQILASMLGSNDHVEKYNPLKEYCNSLPIWNPTKEDHISELASYVTTDDEEFFKIQFKKMMVRILACSLGRIDFNKQVFTFVGMQQNLGKTTFLRKLIPEQLQDYYKEELNLGDKDSFKSLATDIFIILDEVHSYHKKELNKLKAWISKKMVKVRLPYRRDDMTAKRIANFFATSNDETFLTDTQNVRWLIFKIIKIEHDFGGVNGYEQNINIDDVYSQALYLLNDPNFDCQLTKEELVKMEKRNSELFSQQTSEEELILSHFERINSSDIEVNSKKEFFKTATEVYEILKRKNIIFSKYSPKSIGSALTKLNFEKGQQRINNSDPRHGYYLKVLENELLPTTNQQNSHY